MTFLAQGELFTLSRVNRFLSAKVTGVHNDLLGTRRALHTFSCDFVPPPAKITQLRNDLSWQESSSGSEPLFTSEVLMASKLID